MDLVDLADLAGKGLCKISYEAFIRHFFDIFCDLFWFFVCVVKCLA